MYIPKLGIVIPCFNEEEALEGTIERLLEVLDDLSSQNIISKDSFLYLVDDGSSDNTFEIVKKFHDTDKRVKGTSFTRNFGNQNAILAGLTDIRELNADCAVTMDADLQQDENVIKDFIAKFKEGNDIVFGVRTDNMGVGFFKRYTSKLFYKVMNILGASIVPNHSEYRLMSKKALDVLNQYGEYSLFLRGLFSQIGMKRASVKYVSRPRTAGKTKFNAYSLTILAINGITSFSIVPLRMVVILGLIIALVSFGFGLEVIYEKFINKTTVPGWATIVVSVCFFSGIQIFCLGIIGEYLGQIFNEVKGRPRYIKEIELI